MSRVGYARVSTGDQDPELQLQQLQGCDRVFVEHASGLREDRPELRACLDYIRPGDTLVVWKLDRLGRSLAHLVRTAEQLQERGIGFVSMTEKIDTQTPHGRLLFGLLAVLAEFERALIRERVVAGIAAAKANGRRGGRPAALSPERIRVMHEMLSSGRSQAEVARVLGVSRWTIIRAVSKQG